MATRSAARRCRVSMPPSLAAGGRKGKSPSMEAPMEALAYLDPRTGRTWPLGAPRWCGDDQQPLLLTDLPGIGRDQVEAGTRSLWRYRAALPLLHGEPITMGEGCTPLVPRTIGGATA